MECPLCNSSGIPDDAKSCPQCKADLEAFHLTNKIGKKSKNRLLFGTIVTILLAIVVLAWAIMFVLHPGEDKQADKEIPNEEFSLVKADLEKTQNQNEQLKNENKELSDKSTESTAKREKTYIVQEGESLFTIARKIMGNGYKYVDIAKDNNIEDPYKVLIGQKLIIYY